MAGYPIKWNWIMNSVFVLLDHFQLPTVLPHYNANADYCWRPGLYHVAYCVHAFCRHWQHELDRRRRGKTPRLWVAVVKLFWVKLVAQFILCTFEVCSKIHAWHVTFIQSACSHAHTFSIATGCNGSIMHRESPCMAQLMKPHTAHAPYPTKPTLCRRLKVDCNFRFTLYCLCSLPSRSSSR